MSITVIGTYHLHLVYFEYHRKQRFFTEIIILFQIIIVLFSVLVTATYLPRHQGCLANLYCFGDNTKKELTHIIGTHLH